MQKAKPPVVACRECGDLVTMTTAKTCSFGAGNFVDVLGHVCHRCRVEETTIDTLSLFNEDEHVAEESTSDDH